MADRRQARNAPVPPNNQDAEESVLGAVLISPVALDRVTPLVAAEDFYRGSHGLIFRAALAVAADGHPVDAVTVAARLDADGTLADAGGAERIHELAALVPAAGNAPHYARIVREQATRRGLIAAGGQVAALGWEPGDDVPEAVASAERIVFDLASAQRGGTADFVTADQVAAETITLMEEQAKAGRDIVGLATGYAELDRLTSGLRGGQLAVVAGRPSMGKSALAFGMIAHTLRDGLPVALFTYEMTRVEVMQRLLSIDALVQSSHITNPTRLDREDWSRVMEASNRMAAAPLHIDDSKTATMLDVRSRARRLASRVPLALVVVDYIQLMQSGSTRWEGRTREVDEISRGLKLMAGELDVPVLALSQLSRQVEQRHDKRPILSDLRESGSIEQDADLVMLLYRGSYYFPEDDAVQGIAEVDVAKQRNGPTRVCKLAFVDRYARFSDLKPGP